MKKLIIGTLFLGVTSLLMAQSTDDYLEVMRSVLKTEKKAAIAEVMNLSEAESEVFWPLYNEFNEKMYAVQTKRVNIINDFAKNYESITDEKADELWTGYMKYRQELLNLNKQYFKKFKKIMPAGKVMKYFQAENKIATLVDFELAKEVPFINQD
jgi:hypothetical protein